MTAGRISFPRIVQYELEDGTISNLPPPFGAVFKLLIHDVPAYEKLARSGALYMNAHAGQRTPVIDNAKTA